MINLLQYNKQACLFTYKIVIICKLLNAGHKQNIMSIFT